MVLVTIMRKTIKLLFAATLILFFSCEDQGLIVKCPDCTTDEPVSTNLEVKLDQIMEFDASRTNINQINVYEGNIEDSVLYSSFQSSLSTYSIPVTINKKYTVTATYLIKGNYYIAIDSATPRVRFEKSQCDDPCYFVYDRKIDLRLKYTK
jgi:hypothetical protein